MTEHALNIFELASGRYAVSCTAGDVGVECATREEAERIVWAHLRALSAEKD